VQQRGPARGVGHPLQHKDLAGGGGLGPGRAAAAAAAAAAATPTAKGPRGPPHVADNGGRRHREAQGCRAGVLVVGVGGGEAPGQVQGGRPAAVVQQVGRCRHVVPPGPGTYQGWGRRQGVVPLRLPRPEAVVPTTATATATTTTAAAAAAAAEQAMTAPGITQARRPPHVTAKGQPALAVIPIPDGPFSPCLHRGPGTPCTGPTPRVRPSGQAAPEADVGVGEQAA
jgi:hypothetical protein